MFFSLMIINIFRPNFIWVQLPSYRLPIEQIRRAVFNIDNWRIEKKPRPSSRRAIELTESYRHRGTALNMTCPCIQAMTGLLSLSVLYDWQRVWPNSVLTLNNMSARSSVGREHLSGSKEPGFEFKNRGDFCLSIFISRNVFNQLLI